MDKVLLVTGASRGIGAATARLAAQDGWAVAVNYTANSLAADEVVRTIRATGGNAITVQADVADEAQVLRMFETLDAKLGRLTGLVNNAGVVDVTARLDEMSVARWRRMFDINVIGSLLCAREAVRRMSTRHGGQRGQGRDRRFHHRPGQGGGGRGHPRQRRASGVDRDRDPRLGRPARPGARPATSGADAARGYGP